jgi:hypothetical protein
MLTADVPRPPESYASPALRTTLRLSACPSSHEGSLCHRHQLGTLVPFRRASCGASPKRWSWRRDLNPRPADYKSAALPTELRQPDKTEMVARSVPSGQSAGPPQPRYRSASYFSPPRRRWPTASNNAMPADTDTFKLETFPLIGIETTRSQVSLTRRRSPVPSAPSTKAVGCP